MARSIKKIPAKNRATKPVAKKTVIKKKAVVKKNISSTAGKKALAGATRTTPGSIQMKTTRLQKPVGKAANKKAVVAVSKAKTKITGRDKTPGAINQNLPPVEEKSPELAQDASIAPGMDKRSWQRAAIRNYDNHRIGLSNVKKGGIKPTGKKPLW